MRRQLIVFAWIATLATFSTGSALSTAGCGSASGPPASAPPQPGVATSTNPADPTNSVELATPGNLPGPTVKYDPARNPADDLKLAVAEATRTHKRILLEVGGEWCVWCHIMDQYFADHPALTKYRDEHFITMRVNYSEENDNKPFLSQYPKIGGYPHLFVLESNGSVLHSQNTADLESGRSYDLDRFTTFLKQWAAAQ